MKCHFSRSFGHFDSRFQFHVVTLAYPLFLLNTSWSWHCQPFWPGSLSKIVEGFKHFRQFAGKINVLQTKNICFCSFLLFSQIESMMALTFHESNSCRLEISVQVSAISKIHFPSRTRFQSICDVSITIFSWKVFDARNLGKLFIIFSGNQLPQLAWKDSVFWFFYWSILIYAMFYVNNSFVHIRWASLLRDIVQLRRCWNQSFN